MERGRRSLGGLRLGISGIIGENGRNFGGPERHLGIVAVSTLKSGGPMGEIDFEC